jgi:hypothetical protein
MSLLVACCLLCPAGACQKGVDETGKGAQTMAIDPYPIKFSDARRSSSIPFPAGGVGAIEWERPLSTDSDGPFNSVGVLLGQQVVVVYSEQRVICFSPDGRKLWAKDIFYRSPVWLVDDTAFFQRSRQIDRLEAVAPDGNDLKTTLRILDADRACAPVYLQPEGNGFYALCRCRPAKEVGPPYFKFYRKQYEPDEYDWVGEMTSEAPLLPLLIPEQRRFVVVSENEVLVLNADTKQIVAEEIRRFPLPVAGLQCSASTTGDLYLIGGEERPDVLVALSLDGKELWRYEGTEGLSQNAPGQPPMVGPDGTVFLLGTHNVVALQNGQMTRQYSTGEDSIRFGSVLSDGSILIAAGRKLYQYAADAELPMTVRFDETPVTPPVIDSHGRIYLATINTLFKIE